MALSAKVISADATLNNFQFIESAQFIPEENLTIAFQIIQPEKSIRYVPPATAIITFKFNKTDNSVLEKVMTFVDVLDRSLVKCSFTPAETEVLMAGNVTFEIDVLGDGTNIKLGFIYNALSRQDLEC